LQKGSSPHQAISVLRHHIISNTASLTTLYTAKKAAMRITNQKNGTQGSLISHGTSGTKACPVHTLARHVHTITNHPMCTATDIISTYYSAVSKRPRPLQAGNINSLIKSAVKALQLDKNGFPPESVSSPGGWRHGRASQ
jgi:hypothetical protein